MAEEDRQELALGKVDNVAAAVASPKTMPSARLSHVQQRPDHRCKIPHHTTHRQLDTHMLCHRQGLGFGTLHTQYPAPSSSAQTFMQALPEALNRPTARNMFAVSGWNIRWDPIDNARGLLSPSRNDCTPRLHAANAEELAVSCHSNGRCHGTATGTG